MTGRTISRAVRISDCRLCVGCETGRRLGAVGGHDWRSITGGAGRQKAEVEMEKRGRGRIGGLVSSATVRECRGSVSRGGGARFRMRCHASAPSRSRYQVATMPRQRSLTVAVPGGCRSCRVQWRGGGAVRDRPVHKWRDGQGGPGSVSRGGKGVSEYGATPRSLTVAVPVGNDARSALPHGRGTGWLPILSCAMERRWAGVKSLKR